MATDSKKQARRDAHARLDELLDQFESIELADDLTQQIAGMALLADAAAFAGSMAGAQTMIRVYGSQRAGSDRSKMLTLLGQRLSVAAHLFRGIWIGDGFDVSDAASEAFAVAAGDSPRVFARLASKRVPARAATYRLRALEWDAYLDARGESATVRQAKIANAFGASSWDTVRKWPALLVQELGRDAFEFALADARQAGTIAKAGGDPASPKWGKMDDWHRELVNDGRRLLAELKAKSRAQ